MTDELKPCPFCGWNRRALPDREALQCRIADLVLAAVEDSVVRTKMYTIDGATIWEYSDRILALLEGGAKCDSTE